uniref:Uncharacterized protein n=1 Tax=Sphaerodactylus townsendi TaxID=933632 RepID=A0ACB8ETZ4_9SAUR
MGAADTADTSGHPSRRTKVGAERLGERAGARCPAGETVGASARLTCSLMTLWDPGMPQLLVLKGAGRLLGHGVNLRVGRMLRMAQEPMEVWRQALAKWREVNRKDKRRREEKSGKEEKGRDRESES